MSSEYSRERGDDLLARILDGEKTDSGGDEAHLANELLKECWRGYPIELIRDLLWSDVESAVKSGAFIASELAELSHPLLSDIEPLINHQNRSVRGDAIDAVNLAATVDDGEIVAHAIEHITDNERPVRWRAFRLLAASKRERLEAARGFVQDIGVKEALRSALDEEVTVSSDEIRSRLADQSQLVRLFGLLGAARISNLRADDLLAAAETDEEEVRTFALREALRRRLLSPSEFQQRGG